MKKLLFLTGILIATSASGQIETRIIGPDSLCIGQTDLYSVEVSGQGNKYLFRDTVSTGSLNAGYSGNIITNTFSFDLWVKPTRAVNMVGESNACYGTTSVPMANSNQNWAVYPSNAGAGNLGTGLSIGTNGLMIAEHSEFILVARLSHTVSITDWVHVAVVYRSDSVFLYLNGDLVRSRVTHCSHNNKFVPASLSAVRYSPEFQGNIDEFRLWDVALTQSEVREIKDKKILNQISGLRYYASFDDGKFERTLGDIGTESMSVGGELTPEVHIRESLWNLDAYTGSGIHDLVPLDVGQYDFIWSTGSTESTTSYTPVEEFNQLWVTTSNASFSDTDSIIVVGEECCTQTVYDTIIVYDTIPQRDNNVRYIKYESYYSADGGQVNVYEIQAYYDGANVALNRPGFANSYEYGDYSSNGSQAVDNNGSSRWSSDRDDPGPDSINPHFIVIDLESFYKLDSIGLNLQGFDSHLQIYDLSISKDSVQWHSIGKGDGITGIFSYSPENGNSVPIYDTISVIDTVQVIIYDTMSRPDNKIRYIKYESYYSADAGQVNVYEIEAYYDGANVAMNRPGFANSYEWGDYASNGSQAVDNNGGSRWSSDRSDPGPDSINPHFIVIDLEDIYTLDSINLNIQGGDFHLQVYDLSVSGDSVLWQSIGKGDGVTGIFSYIPNIGNTVPIYDTITVMDTISVMDTVLVNVYDSISVYDSIAVTDTLIIDAVLTGIASPDNINTLKIYPNPAKDFLFINTGDYARMNGYRLKIFNQLGATVFDSNIEQPLYEVNLSNWTGKGMYFVQVIDDGGEIIDIRKIILQ